MKKLFDNEKRKRNLTLAVVGLIAAALIWMTLDFGKKKEKPIENPPSVNVIKKEETLEEGFRSKFGQDLVNLKDSNDKIKAELESLKEENTKLKNDISTANTMMSESMKLPEPEYSSGNNTMAKIPPPPGNVASNTNPSQYQSNSQNPNGSQNMQPVITVMTGLISVGQPIGKNDSEQKAKEPKKINKQNLIIPAGSFVKASLLSGVIAPTMGQGASDPVPVLMRITGLTQLPNLHNADVKNCFLLAETKGNLATETVSFRLKSLACRKSDGSTIEKAVDGYVTGENGVEGLQGRVVSKQGAMIVRAFASEFLGGLAKTFEESGKTVSTTGSGLVTTFNPDTALQTGLFSGASGAFSRVSEFYMDLADNMVPVIEINAGRNVDVVFIKSINLSDEEAK